MLLYRNPEEKPFEKILHLILRIAMVFGVISLILEYGFFVSEHVREFLHKVDIGVVAFFILYVLLNWVVARNKKKYAKQYWLEISLVAMFFLQVALTHFAAPGFAGDFLEVLHINNPAKVYIFIIQLYLVINLILEFARFNARLASANMNPAAVLLLGYLFLIILGTLFLLLPKASASAENPISSLDALFTSTSATCVTGLAVRDTGNDFSTTGQMIILFLIQLGGLGLVTFTMFFTLLQQRFLGVRQTVFLRDVFNLEIIGDLGKFLTYVFAITFCIEFIGAALLYQFWELPNLDFDGRIKWSVFHSVSAFCNAGFALIPNSLVDYAGHHILLWIIMALIVLGGLGYPVIMNLLQFRLSTLPMFLRSRWIRSHQDTKNISHLSIQTKIVLITTLVLILGGTFVFFGLEYNNTLKDKPLSQKVTGAFFQSVTSRTAGFNTVNIGESKPPTLVAMIGLMFVGASPLSTGGGVKTVTFVVLLATVFSMMRSRTRVEIGKRSLPAVVIRTAVSITVLYLVCAFVFSFLLTISDPQVPYLNTLFETVSALSTVGVSTGITASLSVYGKLMLCAMMLIGRIGPLVILLSIIRRTSQARYQYPEETVILT